MATKIKALTIIGCAADMPLPAGYAPLFENPVSAGYPEPGEDMIETDLNLHELVVKNPPATFFLRASGQSMIGVGIHDRDLLVVDRSVEATNNRVVIAAIEGELLVKTLAKRGGRVLLLPANPDYPVIDITEREYVHVWGVVTWTLHKL